MHYIIYIIILYIYIYPATISRPPYIIFYILLSNNVWISLAMIEGGEGTDQPTDFILRADELKLSVSGLLWHFKITLFQNFLNSFP